MAFSVVTGRVFFDNTGASRELPILISEAGAVRPLIDYCLSVHRSLAWQEKLLRAVKLLLEYLEVNTVSGEEDWRLFRNFANALRQGTVNPETLNDPSGLYWAGIDQRQSNFMVSQLSDFFEWLGREDAPRALQFNPRYQRNAYDHHIELQAYRYRRNQAFLGHVWSTSPRESRARVTRNASVPKVFPVRPLVFPEERFEELLFKGFKVGGRYDFRGMLITLMLFGGGFRVSEPFHLYIADVQPDWEDSSKAFVAVHHPSLGYAPNSWKNHAGKRGSRQEYLATEFGLTPRHVVRGSLNAGWKHPALDRHWYMHVYWYPEHYGQWFMQIWTRYLEQVVSIERTHPYAWINIGREPGGIYCMDQYKKALMNAVERIGLIFGKTYGTTAHGFRHAYGQRARRGEISEVIIQRLLHHCSPESQRVYTQPEMSEARSAIRLATQKLHLAYPDSSSIFDRRGN